VVNVVQNLKNGETASQTSALVIPYPPEYKDIHPNTFLLNQVAKTSGGRMNPDARDIFHHPKTGARVPTDLWKILTLLAAILLPLDVAVRRLNVNWSDASEIFAAVSNRVLPKRQRRTKTVEQVATLGTLKCSQRTRKQDIDEDREEVLKRIKESTGDAPQPSEPARPVEPRPQASAPASRPEPQPKAQTKEEPKPAAEEQDSMSKLLETKRRLRERK
jgi:hypothetical protein